MTSPSAVPGTPAALLVIAVLLLVTSLLGAACGASGEESDRVVVRVDGTPILDSEVRASVAAAALGGQELGYGAARDQLVDAVLVAGEAERLGLRVDPTRVEAEVDAAAEAYGGRKALASVLRRSGLTLETYGDRFAAALLAERVADVKFAGVRASAGQAREYVANHPDEFLRPAEFDLGDIVVKTEKQGDAVRERLAGGQSFESAATQYSTDPQGREDGGRMGWVSAESVPAGLRTVLQRSRVGDVTPPLEASGVWHVLKLYGRRDERRLTFAEVRGELVEDLTRRRRVEALRRWLDTARERADIEVAK